MVKEKKRAVRSVKKTTIAKGLKVKRGVQSKLQKKPGGSNVGEYKGVSKGDFCGPSGGAPKGSYPVNTRKRAIAAKAYSRHAPNPAGIKKCVNRKWPDLDKKSKKKK